MATLVRVRVAVRPSNRFPRLLEILLPKGGYAMTLVEAYFDESGTHDDSPIICMGGYIFDSDNARALSVEWQVMLNEYGDGDNPLPYFHMAECNMSDRNDMGIGIYRHLTAKQCDECAREAIALIKKYALWGVMISLDLSAFGKFMHNEKFPTPYSFVAFQTLLAVRYWANQAKYTGPIAFIYEAGADHNDEAHKLISEVAAAPQLRGDYRYGGHTFQRKEEALPLQTADILAWHTLSNLHRRRAGKRVRPDLKSLSDVMTKVNHYDEEAARKMQQHVAEMELYVLKSGAKTKEEQYAARAEYLRRFGM